MHTQLKENIKKITEKVNCREDCDKCPLYTLPFSCGAPCTDDDVELSLTKMYSGCKDFVKMVEEYKESVLDEIEKKYLTNILRPFVNRYKVSIVKKENFNHSLQYIVIYLTDKYGVESLDFPYFKSGTMYKGMKPYKEYGLKDLGLKF